MKASQVLAFLLGVFALMGLAWLAFPSEGVAAGPATFRFPTYRAMLEDASEHKVNVDSVLLAVESRFQMESDTLDYYRCFFSENPDRIYMPHGDIHYFDNLFRRFENASDRPVRVIHYGDSQIEMDRISSDLRDALQERFGGMGTGMFPALGNVPSASIYKKADGAFAHYTMYGDSTTQRAGHNRYGIMAQVVSVGGSGSLYLRATSSKSAYERCKSFRTVSVLYGKDNAFKVKAVSDTLRPEPQIQKGPGGTTLVTWDFGRSVAKARLSFSGNAEIYGVSTDGNSGVAVDNIPLRGCSGTIFTRISKPLMTDCMHLMDAGLIILQFGGNYMPVASSSKIISSYCENIARQIQYFHEAAPDAAILFIGPSDMGVSRGGKMVTRPRLGEMVDSLKATALSNDAAFWDLYHMMGGENSMAQWVKHNPPYAGADYTHFTPAGARKVGDALSKSLLTCYDYYTLRDR